MKAIEVKNLSYLINDKIILKNISFAINEGEFISLIGKNGSGKSTLSLALLSIIETKGSIKINGKIGIVLENPDNQIIGTTVEDDIVFGLQNIGMDRENMEKTLLKVLKEFEIEDLRKREITSLSGGQKQKIAFASLVAMEYDIYILDEVTSMLDPESKKMINNLIKKLLLKGKTIIQITHFINEVSNSEKSIILNEGSLIYFDKTKKLLKDKELLLSNNLIAEW